MRVEGENVSAILSEIQGLLHEAKSNVEIDGGKAQRLITRVLAAGSAQGSGALSSDELTAMIGEVSEGIKASIEKELSIDNPEAAVLQIRALLDRLKESV